MKSNKHYFVYTREPDPAKYDGIYVSCSGGKDSVAAALFLKKRGIPFQCIFFDVGWEHPDTYEYLDHLEGTLGPIKRLRAEVGWPDEMPNVAEKFSTNDPEACKMFRQVAARQFREKAEPMAQELERMLGLGYSAMVRLCLRKRLFPTDDLKFCTQTLKLDVAARFFAAEKTRLDSENLLDVAGIRAEESPQRAKYPVYEFDPGLGVAIWRPIHALKLQDVIDLHAEFGLAPNPLYLRRSRRVGCWPCIHAGEDELAALDDGRIAVIRRLEACVAELQDYVNVYRGERRKYAPPSFIARVPPGTKKEDIGAFGVPNGFRMPIDDVVRNARAGKDGKELTPAELRARLPKDVGCKRWGLCAATEEVP